MPIAQMIQLAIGRRRQLERGAGGPGRIVHQIDVGPTLMIRRTNRHRLRLERCRGERHVGQPSIRGTEVSQRLFLSHGQHPTAIEQGSRIERCQAVREALAIAIARRRQLRH